MSIIKDLSGIFEFRVFDVDSVLTITSLAAIPYVSEWGDKEASETDHEDRDTVSIEAQAKPWPRALRLKNL